MVKFKAVHQCLICQQTFDSAADKDDHILGHFSQETCAECNQNLIRIGGYLYVRHNEATCIKKVPISGDPLECDEGSTATSLVILNAFSMRMPEIKTEPVDQHENEDILIDTDNFEPNILKKTDVMHTAQSKIKQEVLVQENHEQINECESTEQCEIEPETQTHALRIWHVNLNDENLNMQAEYPDPANTIEISNSPKKPNYPSSTCDESFQSVRGEDNLTGIKFGIKLEELLIDSSPNELQSQQDDSDQCDDGDATFVMQNSKEQFICEICKKEFSKRSNLQDHIRRRRHGPNANKFKCSICGQLCINERKLQTHIGEIHLNLKKFRCNACEKSFKYKSHLIQHERVHKGKIPFKCSYCDERFTSHSNKFQHEQSHTGEKRNACEKAFSSNTETKSTEYPLNKNNNLTKKNNTVKPVNNGTWE
ncbi:zinc finger protein 594-like [Sitodiplosis mosellana]|uniref:zinc finger protein 594-like n=1 Tax=Sitodiplosis mosellana TaxID=263140 RepID=UPI002444A977|nr:zinc finger protein 594-like [Sitodiplosis mosellana]